MQSIRYLDQILLFMRDNEFETTTAAINGLRGLLVSMQKKVQIYRGNLPVRNPCN